MNLQIVPCGRRERPSSTRPLCVPFPVAELLHKKGLDTAWPMLAWAEKPGSAETKAPSTPSAPKRRSYESLGGKIDALYKELFRLVELRNHPEAPADLETRIAACSAQLEALESEESDYLVSAVQAEPQFPRDAVAKMKKLTQTLVKKYGGRTPSSDSASQDATGETTQPKKRK